jgi:plastocyanin
MAPTEDATGSHVGGGTGMRRTTLLCVLVGAATMVLGFPSAGIAGGGCHGTMTQADATDRDEASVRMVDACFDASVLRVDRGTSVTFLHEDPGLVHNVGGTEWGFYGEMRKGDTFTATFDDAGVYPFACSYHPGMTGAIVVGDALGAGSGWTVLNDDPVESPPKPAAIASTETVGGDGTSALALIAIGTLGLAVGTGVAFGVGRLGRTRTTP